MCRFPFCNRKEEHDGYCIGHKIYSDVPVEKKRKPIPKMSGKRKVEEREYKKIVKEMLSESKECELKVEGVCTGIAQGLHHMKKRTGKNYLDREYLKRACNACNGWAERFPLEAMKLGLSLSKFK